MSSISFFFAFPFLKSCVTFSTSFRTVSMFDGIFPFFTSSFSNSSISSFFDFLPKRFVSNCETSFSSSSMVFLL